VRLHTFLRRLRNRLADDRGYSLIEMLTVMSILAVVMTGLTTLFVQGSNAEVDMNSRFQAQQDARLALDKIRRESHCAQSVTLTGATQATINFPTGSSCGTSVSWCTVSAGTTRYKLFRQVGSTCGSSGTSFADHLTTANVFSYAAQSTTSLAKLTVDLPINVKPSKTQETYELKSDIALRNSSRS
jgi:prepilin-type N-terminal cleavage/methylation domain-containing protein